MILSRVLPLLLKWHESCDTLWAPVTTIMGFKGRLSLTCMEVSHAGHWVQPQAACLQLIPLLNGPVTVSCTLALVAALTENGKNRNYAGQESRKHSSTHRRDPTA